MRSSSGFLSRAGFSAEQFAPAWFFFRIFQEKTDFFPNGQF
jgi:hypothetical protein